MDATGFRYVVEGRYPFPTDMLRRDGSGAATPSDRAEIDRLSMDLEAFLGTDDAPADRRREKVRISLVIPDATRFQRPVLARWESFGWQVVESDDAAALEVYRQEREDIAGRRRDAKLVREALAKLSPEEQAALARHYGGQALARVA